VKREYDPLKYEPALRAKDSRFFATRSEKLVWSWLRNRQLGGYKFRREHPMGEYVLDFYCDEARLVVEIDGSHHGHPAQERHDAVRTRFLEQCGLKVLRFWNSQLRPQRRMILDTIFRELQARAPHPLPDYTKPPDTDRAAPSP